MEEQFDTDAMVSRAQTLLKEVRRSDAFPAIVGGLAGGIAGALIAAIIAGRASSGRTVVESVDEEAAIRSPGRGWTARDLIQLVTVVGSLIAQAQAWRKERQPEKG